MANPAEKKDPKCAAYHEIDERGDEASLDQLSKSGDEEARERGDKIA